MSSNHLCNFIQPTISSSKTSTSLPSPCRSTKTLFSVNNMDDPTYSQDILSIPQSVIVSAEFPKMGDLTNGIGEWRNIQNVVRATFKALCEMIEKQNQHLKAQQEEISRLQSKLDDVEKMSREKPSKSEMIIELNKSLQDVQKEINMRMSDADLFAELKKKASKEELRTELSKKVNVSDFEALVDSKADLNETNSMFEICVKGVEDLKKGLNMKSNTRDVEMQVESLSSAIHDLQSSLKLKASHAELNQLSSDTKVALASRSQELQNLQLAITNIQQGMTLKAGTSAEISSKIEEIKTMLSNKTNTTDFIQKLRKLQSKLLETQKEFETKSKESNIEMEERLQQKIIHHKNLSEQSKEKLMQQIKEISESITRKANIDDVREALSKKVNSSEYDEFVSNTCKRLELPDFKEALAKKADVDLLDKLAKDVEKKANKESVVHALKTKASSKELKPILEKLADIEHIKKEIALKANIKDLLTLLDEKASSEQLNTMSQILKDFAKSKVDQEILDKSLKQQATINEALLAQNTTGRWIWKSGKLKSGHGVPWNLQVLNTCPENFLWEKDRVNLIVVQPGLYEVCFGFFAKKKPAVQLHVNGEPALSAVNSSAYVVHHSSGRSSQQGGNITGLTLIDFVALPERSRIAISYSGEEKAEGFLGLRKL